MEKTKLKELLFSAINSSILAGIEIMKIYEADFDIEYKEDNSPLTLADKKSNDVICNLLNKHNIPSLSEEGSEIKYEERKKWPFFWMIDPLDGTKEFVKKNGDFSI